MSDWLAPVARRRPSENDATFEARRRAGRFDDACVAFIDFARRIYAPNTVRDYRRDLNALLDLYGDRWVADLTARDFDRALAIFAEQAPSKPRAIIRTVGSFLAWATSPEADRLDRDHAVFGGTYGVSARNKTANPSRTTKRIRMQDTPTWDQTLELSEVFTRTVVDRWGPEAAYLGALPLIQHATGTRFREALVLTADDFLLDQRIVQIRRQWEEGTPFTDRYGAIPDREVKNHKYHEALIWGWALEEGLRQVIEDARTRHPNGWLFAPPETAKRVRTWDKNLMEKMNKDMKALSGYTSHYHRHAYATQMLAPPEEGGYGRSVPTVAACLGDTVAEVVKTYWHPVDALDPSWDLTRPGR